MDSLRKQYGLDQPMYVQYLSWVSGFQGDFGYRGMENAGSRPHWQPAGFTLVSQAWR